MVKDRRPLLFNWYMVGGVLGGGVAAGRGRIRGWKTSRLVIGRNSNSKTVFSSLYNFQKVKNLIEDMVKGRGGRERTS